MKNKIFITASILAMLFQCVPANVFAATSPTPVVTTSVVIKDENNDKYPYGKPQTDEVARGSGNREYGCRRLREKLPNFSGVSFLEPGIPVIE